MTLVLVNNDYNVQLMFYKFAPITSAPYLQVTLVYISALKAYLGNILITFIRSFCYYVQFLLLRAVFVVTASSRGFLVLSIAMTTFMTN